MTTPTYQITCPKCGKELQPVALDALTSPWLCAICARGFWAAELSSSARSIYRHTHHDFGFSPERIAIQAQVAIEIEQAQVRGTSLRDDQLDLVHLEVLKNVKVTGAFADQIATALKNRGA